MDSAAFLEALQSVDGEPALQKLLHEFLSGHGVTQYCYVALNLPNRDNPVYFVTNLPTTWLDRYIDKGHILADPVLQQARKTRVPFLWNIEDMAQDASAKQKRIIRDAIDAGIEKGVSFPVHGLGGELACLHIMFDGNDAELEAFRARSQVELLIGALYFHDSLWKHFRHDDDLEDAVLTTRQIEVLTWAAAGKTTWEISRILSISEAGVRFHIKDAAKRLGTYNVTATVARAIAHGFVRA